MDRIIIRVRINPQSYAQKQHKILFDFRAIFVRTIRYYFPRRIHFRGDTAVVPNSFVIDSALIGG